MARPAGDVRRAVLDAIRMDGPGTLREIQARVNAQRALQLASVVDYDTIRATLQNATRGKAPALHICGQAREAHAKCWVSIYDLSDNDTPDPQPATESTLAQACAELAAVVGVWGGCMAHAGNGA